MNSAPRHDPFHGLFARTVHRNGHFLLQRGSHAPASLPDPRTGRVLKIATIELCGASICPSCSGRTPGGFISFVADARMVYACPDCQKLIWLSSV